MTNSELNELKAIVRRAIEEEREMYDEAWMTEKELIAQFGMFTHDWLKKYGHCLQPARAIVVDEMGVFVLPNEKAVESARVQFATLKRLEGMEFERVETGERLTIAYKRVK